MRILTFRKVYLIHGKQRLEWLWVFKPWFQPWNAGVTADLDSPPPSKSAQRIWTPLRRFGPSYQTFLLSILCIILVTNSICKLFVDVLFNHNTTFLNKGKKKNQTNKKKQTAISFQFCRIYYSESYSICKNKMWTNYCIWTIVSRHRAL